MDGLIDKEQGGLELESGMSCQEQGKPSTAPDATFDQWLAHHLKRLYDPVTSEPVPPDLIRLLESRLR